MTRFREVPASPVPFKFDERQGLHVDKQGRPLVDLARAAEAETWMFETMTRIINEEPDDASRVWAETESRVPAPDPADPASPTTPRSYTDDSVTGLVAF
jgi:hypothetical protein